MAQHSDNLLLAGGRKGERAMGVFSTYLSEQNALTKIFLNGNTSISPTSKDLEGDFCFLIHQYLFYVASFMNSFAGYEW